jgi:hypothetical protein
MDLAVSFAPLVTSSMPFLAWLAPDLNLLPSKPSSITSASITVAIFIHHFLIVVVHVAYIDEFVCVLQTVHRLQFMQRGKAA